MIKNLWKNTTLICGKHVEERPTMEFVVAGNDLSYICPICKQKISSYDFEKILKKISDISSERDRNCEWGKLVGEKFTIAKTIKCEIITDEEDGKIELLVKNVANR